MGRFAAPSALKALLFFIVFGAPQPPLAHALPQRAAPGQPDKPCAYLSKADAESILGQNVVLQSDSTMDCWFVQEGFAQRGPNGRQVQLTIFRSDSPRPGDLNARRAQIQDEQRRYGGTLKDVSGFADGALWSWWPASGLGRLNALKGGTLDVQVRIAGLSEQAAFEHAKTLASKVLGGSGKSGFAYDGEAAVTALREVAAKVQSPAAYRDEWQGQKMTFRGTVSDVQVDSSRFPHWVTISFRESPAGAFVACSPYPDMLQDSLGPLTALVGSGLEISGPVEAAMCKNGKGGSIKLIDPKQYSVYAAPSGNAATGHRHESAACEHATNASGPGPSAKDMCYALEDSLEARMRSVAQVNADCNAKGGVRDYATAWVCLLGGLSQVGSDSHASIAHFRKIDCTGSGNRFECRFDSQIRLSAPNSAVFNATPSNGPTSGTFVRSGTGVWIFAP